MVLMLVLGGLGLAELNETVRELAHGAARKRSDTDDQQDFKTCFGGGGWD